VSKEKEHFPLTNEAKRVEANRLRRRQQEDIRLFRHWEIDKQLEHITREQEKGAVALLRPKIVPEDLEDGLDPLLHKRASVNIIFDRDVYEQTQKRIGVMIVRSQKSRESSFTAVGLEIFGSASLVLPVDQITPQSWREAIHEAMLQPRVERIPEKHSLDRIKPRMLDVNPFIKDYQ
jgi:hypothetical protein